ncbi:hypothetical protein ACX4ER_003908 [Cronobacter dublinensis]
MSKVEALQPKYNVGDIVNYTDRHGRKQVGKVRAIEGKWFGYASGPYLVYNLAHPTYQNGQFYCKEDVIKGLA